MQRTEVAPELATPAEEKRRRLRILASGLALVVLGLAWMAGGIGPRLEPVALAVGAAAALVLAAESFLQVFDRWLFGGALWSHTPRCDAATGRWTFRNWGGNQVFTAAETCRPRSLAELIEAVERYGRSGRKIKAVGGLHSWSACAVAEDVCIPMEGLDRVLAHDAGARTITAEAGIRLRDLYREMDQRRLAIASIPNVDTIQLGGAIANATHGTNFSRGTMSSFVVRLQMVVFQAPGSDPSRGRAEMVTLLRDDPDAQRRAWFEAAVTSFGSVGVIYSVTLQCEEPFACMVVEHTFPFAQIDGRIEEIARRHHSAFINVCTSNGLCRSRIQVPVPCDLVEVDRACLLTRSDLRIVKILLWAASPTATTWLRLRRGLNRLLYRASLGGVAARLADRPRAGVMSWRDAELLSRVFAIAATTPWINLEYAVPARRADEAARGLLALHRAWPVLTGFIMRPVGADRAGYLSPTKDRPTVFFDVGYHQELMRTGLYAEIEKLLLACEGRCSWSRLFEAPPGEIVKQYPEYPEFVRAKRQMDPCNVFSNAFSDSILFPERSAALRDVASTGQATAAVV